MPEEDGEGCRITDNCQFCEKNIESNKVRDNHCHLTAKYKGPAYRKNHIIVPQKKKQFYTICFLQF